MLCGLEHLPGGAVSRCDIAVLELGPSAWCAWLKSLSERVLNIALKIFVG